MKCYYQNMYTEVEEMFIQLYEPPHSEQIHDENGTVLGFRTTRVPKLKIISNNAEREIYVEISAKEAKDDQLMHNLLTKVHVKNR